MYFKGYQMTFSTKGDKQYESIGVIWDQFASIYGIENIQGLGFNWSLDTIDYCFGFKEDLSEDEYMRRIETVNQFTSKPFRFNVIELPESDWVNYKGETSKLSELYDDVYSDGRLDYEIETFAEDGSCSIDVHYIKVDETKITDAHKELRSAVALARLFNVIGVLGTLYIIYWFFYLFAVSAFKASFVTIGLPLITLLILGFIHCFFLVNRVNKQKAMAKCLIDMRLDESELMDKAREYRVVSFVDGLLEVQKKANDKKNPL